MTTPTAPSPRDVRLIALSIVCSVLGLTELILASHGGSLEPTLLDGALTSFGIGGAAFAYTWLRGGGGGGGGDLRPIPIRVRSSSPTDRDGHTL